MGTLDTLWNIQDVITVIDLMSIFSPLIYTITAPNYTKQAILHLKNAHSCLNSAQTSRLNNAKFELSVKI